MNRLQSTMDGRTSEEKISTLPIPYQQKISVDYETGCWNWVGSRRPDGYGLMYVAELKKQRRSHRLVYELLVRPIADGLVIDHLCRNPACCNPDHLEEVTNRTNVLRGVSPFAAKNKQTHCKHGHELSGENLYIHPQRGTRNCRKCLNDYSRSRRAGLVGNGSCACGNPSYAKGMCQSCYMVEYRRKKVSHG
jgi:hypothetical protein